MNRAAHRVFLLALLIAFVVAAPGPIAAQGDPDGVTSYRLNLRAGSGTHHARLAVLPGGTGLYFEARNEDISWLLVHTGQDQRGWVSSLYVQPAPGVAVVSLPVSDEVLPPPTASTAPEAVPAALPVPALASYDPSRVNGIDLNAYPVLPANLGRARAIFLAGQAMGRNPHALSKVGDCASDHPDFLAALARPDRNLGAYADALLPVITQFADSLTANSQAAHPGFNAATLTDPMWTDPAACAAGETTLGCEFRLRNPALAVIMFGTTDLQTLTPPQYDAALRTIVAQSISAGVIPVLSTFPPHTAFPTESLLYNKIVVRIALDYDVPLINLWLALQPLPNQGMALDGTHLGEPVYGGPGWLVPQNLSSGLPLHNLVTMQAVDLVWRGAMQ